jgi:hypothetical protein
MASAGCNALGAIAVGQRCHQKLLSNAQALTIEQPSVPTTARCPFRIQSPSLWRHSDDGCVWFSTGAREVATSYVDEPINGRVLAPFLSVVDIIRYRLPEIFYIERRGEISLSVTMVSNVGLEAEQMVGIEQG